MKEMVVAGHRGRPRRVRARPGGGRARAATAGRARTALQPPVEVSAAVVVDGVDGRGVPAVSSMRCERRNQAQRCVDTISTRGRPVSLTRRRGRRRPALLARFTGLRTCTARLARSAQHGPQCPERELSPCPAPRDICAADYADAPSRATALIEGARQPCTARRCSPDIAELADCDRYETAARLRDHATTAIEVLWRGQRLRALAVGQRDWSRHVRTAKAVGVWR